MSLTTSMLTVLLMLMLLIMITPPLLIFYLWRRDRNQREHSVLRNFPILGKLRYIFEKMGPELRQYLFLNDNEAKPFSRNEYESAVIAGKYKSRIIGFGSERDFEAGGFYLQNALYPTHRNELRVNQSTTVSTWVNELDEANLFTRKEHLPVLINRRRYRSLREGLYNMAAAAGGRFPAELSEKHVISQESDGRVRIIE